MNFSLVPIETAADFVGIAECQWAAYENPLQGFFRMFCPLRGEGGTARKESIQESSARQWREHTEDEKSHWIKVIDDRGKIVGASLWKLCPENPFGNSDDQHEVYWHPPGERREYVSAALEIFDAPRRNLGARPQVYLNILFTHPEYRRQGVADLMLAWGIKKADEMGVEMWLDATRYGVPAYQKHGFIVVNENPIQPTKSHPGAEWKAIEKTLGPMVFWQMWRPAGGKTWPETTAKPWEQ